MPRKIRPILIKGNIAHIPLTQGYTAIIDAADAPLVEGRNWSAKEKRRSDGSLGTAYAQRGVRITDGRRTTVYLHRVILDAPEDMECDHINGDGLDNRRENLRLASHAENGRNRRTRHDSRSGVKGVYWDMGAGKWRAQIQANGRQKHLGLFTDIDAAAAAYAVASADLHGQWGSVT